MGKKSGLASRYSRTGVRSGNGQVKDATQPHRPDSKTIPPAVKKTTSDFITKYRETLRKLEKY